MSIAWQYLDKKNAAISALKDYESMQYILAHTPSDIALVESSMVQIDAPQLTSIPKGQRNPHSGENRIVKHLDSLNVLQERFRRAQEFCDWFQPAWQGLNGAGRFTLSCFYLETDGEVDPVGAVCDHFHIERTSAYKKKDRALAHLALLLYGK